MAAKGKSKNSKETVRRKARFSPSQVKDFVAEVNAEFLKIVWPDKKMTLGLTGVVVVLTIVISFYLGSVDLLLGKIISSFLR